MKNIKLLSILLFFLLVRTPCHAEDPDLSNWEFIESIDFLDLEPIKPFKREFFYAIYSVGQNDLNKAQYWLLSIIDNQCWYGAYFLGTLYLGVDQFPADYNRASYWLERSLHEVHENPDKAKIANILAALPLKFIKEHPHPCAAEEDFVLNFCAMHMYQWHLIADFFNPHQDEHYLSKYEEFLSPEHIQQAKTRANNWLRLHGYI